MLVGLWSTHILVVLPEIWWFSCGLCSVLYFHSVHVISFSIFLAKHTSIYCCRGKVLLLQNVFLVTSYGTVMIWIICNNDFKSCQKENLVGIQWLNDGLGSEFWSMNIIDKPGLKPRQPEGTFPHNGPKIVLFHITFLIQNTRVMEHEPKYNNLFSK